MRLWPLKKTIFLVIRHIIYNKIETIGDVKHET